MFVHEQRLAGGPRSKRVAGEKEERSQAAVEPQGFRFVGTISGESLGEGGKVSFTASQILYPPSLLLAFHSWSNGT